MKPKSFMFIAGEASGDRLAAELASALREELAEREARSTFDSQPLEASLEPRFFGAGGPCMAAAGVELEFDMTAHSAIGFSDVFRGIFKFRRLFNELYQLAVERAPDVIIGVDYSGFNRRFIGAVKNHVRKKLDWFHPWNPRLVQYVSPQVWASREGRIHQVARDYDLLLSIIPFEKEWYARRVPGLRVDFVGHPIVDRFGNLPSVLLHPAARASSRLPVSPLVLLLPGSRRAELTRHFPEMRQAWVLMRAAMPHLRARMVLPNEDLLRQAKAMGLPPALEVRIGGLAESLAESDVAIASTGTVTMECAFFGVPTVALYKTSWSTYQIGKRIVKVKYLAMPNLLAKEAVFPEFIQDAATGDNLAGAALELLRDSARRERMVDALRRLVESLGPPGASRRAARAILRLL